MDRLGGAVVILFGLIAIVRSKKWGKRASEFHRGVEKRLPWLYWLPPAKMATSADGASVLYLFIGICFVGAGTLWLVSG
jgi:hypothetical protein